MVNNLYRPCVGITLFNKDGQVFVGERIDNPGAWQMPQGGIDEGEDLLIAAKRELKEEIGSNNATLLKIHDEKILYDIPADILERLHKEWDTPYIGQEQIWVAMRFDGEDSEINLEADDHPEFSRWQWVDLDKTINLIVPFKRDTYQKVISAFKKFA
ncbi:MAG: RNA pyrophosphohydrolase [Pseudomonadota bacterium]